MNALELMGALEKSGTGVQKMDAARAVARHKGTTLKAMPGKALLAEMQRRHRKWRELMDMGGPRRQGLVLPPECLPGACWPEGTIAKAERILKGLPADLPAMAASSVYDVDEAPPAPRPVPVALEEAEEEPPVPPGIHGVDPQAGPSMPGIRHGGKKKARLAARAEEEPAAHLDGLESQPAE
jgi:hypothetical protein